MSKLITFRKLAIILMVLFFCSAFTIGSSIAAEKKYIGGNCNPVIPMEIFLLNC